MIARIALVLERVFLDLARWLSRYRSPMPQQPAWLQHTLTDAELERIADRALDRALETTLYAPEITVWQERTLETKPQRGRKSLREFEDDYPNDRSHDVSKS